MDDASPAPHHESSSVVHAIERKLSPGVLLLVAVLALVFFIFGLLNLLIQSVLRLRQERRRRRRVGDAAADGSPTSAFQGQLGQLFHLHDAGVDQAFIDALPVFPYRAVAASTRGCKGKDDDGGQFDCAVCLCEFEMDDQLRLLPTCGHAFHAPCIDAWLLAHSTCPLCRGSILADCDPPESDDRPFVLVLAGSTESDVPERDGGRDPGRVGDGEDEESPPKAEEEEEIVEVKLGKLRCVDGNASARDLAVVDGTSSNRLGQRRCLSMGSYEYVMDDRAALRVAVKTTTPKRRPRSRSRRRHALSECDFGGSKKGAREAAVTTAEAGASTGRGATILNKDSFSVSKIWIVSSSRNDDTRTSSELMASGRRAVSFRWPAMAAGWKKQNLREEEASWDVEEAASRGDSTVPSLVEERQSMALLWASSGERQSSKSSSHS